MVTDPELVLLRAIQKKKPNRPVKRRYIEMYAFLYQRETGSRFWAWQNQNGPISKDVRNDLDTLTANGFLTEKESPTFGGETRIEYQLTDKAADNLSQLDIDRVGFIDEVLNEWGDLPISNLIHDVCAEERHFSVT